MKTPQSGCVITSPKQKGTQPLCGWEFSKLAPRVAEAANPGLEGATALRFHLEVSRFFKSDDFAGETDMLFH